MSTAPSEPDQQYAYHRPSTLATRTLLSSERVPTASTDHGSTPAPTPTTPSAPAAEAPPPAPRPTLGRRQTSNYEDAVAASQMAQTSSSSDSSSSAPRPDALGSSTLPAGETSAAAPQLGGTLPQRPGEDSASAAAAADGSLEQQQQQQQQQTSRPEFARQQSWKLSDARREGMQRMLSGSGVGAGHGYSSRED